MKSFALTLILMSALVQVHSGCINCGLGDGRDVCKNGQNCSPMIVRPAKLQRIDLNEIAKPRVVCKQVGGLPPLKPVGDLCSCRQAIVSPAIIPRPACALCKQECNHQSSASSSSSSSSSSSVHIGGYEDHETSYEKEHVFIPTSSSSISTYSSSNPSHTVINEYRQENGNGHVHLHSNSYTPADPVSLSLAYKLQSTLNNVAEDKLAFGFRTMPKEIKVIKKVKNIPEENLYGINGQIVELKPARFSGGITVDEEAAEDLMNEELDEEIVDVPVVKKLTYGEIGFAPAKISKGSFVAVEGNGEVNNNAASASCSSKKCEDGFVPGNVIIKSIPKTQVYVQSPSIPNIYDDEDEDESVAMPVSYPAFSYSSSSSSASSAASSSSSSSHAHGVIFEKLGCN